MTAEIAMVLAVCWPLFGALLVGLSRSPNLRDGTTMVIAVSLFWLIVSTILPAATAGERPRIELFELLPGLPVAFELEPLGMLFALVASGLWIITSLYAFGYMRSHHEKNQTRFFICFALAIFGAMGVAFSANMLTLFIFYELITLSTYPLVTHHGTAEAKASGRKYLGILMGTSVGFLLLALIWTWQMTGTTEFEPGGILTGKASEPVLIGLLALYAFGTAKAALMPFHRWLPAAMVAPTPVSALLHAVAVVKAGVFTILKVVVYIFGIELLTTTGASDWLAWAATGTLLTASVIALTKDNLKARLAYSTISQLAYIVLGAALATQQSIIGGGLHIAMHAFGKITLFFCAGAIYVHTHKKKVSELDGLGRKMPLTFLAFLLGALSIIGIPPLGGSWSKWYLAMGAVDADMTIMVGVLMLSSLLSIGYLMPIVGRAFFAKAPTAHPHGDDHGHEEPDGEAPFLCVMPPVVTALGCVLLFVFASSIHQLLSGIFSS